MARRCRRGEMVDRRCVLRDRGRGPRVAVGNRLRRPARRCHFRRRTRLLPSSRRPSRSSPPAGRCTARYPSATPPWISSRGDLGEGRRDGRSSSSSSSSSLEAVNAGSASPCPEMRASEPRRLLRPGRHRRGLPRRPRRWYLVRQRSPHPGSLPCRQSDRAPSGRSSTGSCARSPAPVGAHPIACCPLSCGHR